MGKHTKKSKLQLPTKLCDFRRVTPNDIYQKIVSNFYIYLKILVVKKKIYINNKQLGNTN